ncbi:MAG TPA: hypothetical protein VFR58_10595 [Flavisolibacter sp.]|nr:hypothetical protein [Flavisolibacter sp.]
MLDQTPAKRISSSAFPLVLALAVTALAVFFLQRSILNSTGGVFMYPLDDPFIHMQVARNLAFNQIWGIVPGEFGSASSSILYTLLLTGIFKLTGVNVAVPFVLNCIAAFFLLLCIHRWLVRQGVRSTARAIVLLLVVVLVPLPVLIISGMEHTLQCLFFFLFLTRFSAWLAALGRSKTAIPVDVLLYALLLTAIRYEGLFPVAIASCLLLYHRKIGPAFLLGAAALLPVIVFGAASIAKGSYFLPNSVLVKSEGMEMSLRGIAAFVNNILVNKLTVTKAQGSVAGVPPPGISLLSAQRLLLILPLVWLACWTRLKTHRALGHMLALLLLSTLLHLALASTGWFYRYEAYLIAAAVVLVPAVLLKYTREDIMRFPKPVWGPALVLAFALLFPFVLRSSAAFTKAKQACVNIYEQQYQMARFLGTYYDKDVVAANDIGAISLYTNARVVDLWGLGSIEVARSKKGKYWTPAYLDSFVRAKDVKLAIVYDEWFDPALLGKWSKVATWQVGDNVILGGDTVSFYAINAADSGELQRNLQAFEAQLPAGVAVRYE